MMGRSDGGRNGFGIVLAGLGTGKVGKGRLVFAVGRNMGDGVFL